MKGSRSLLTAITAIFLMVSPTLARVTRLVPQARLSKGLAADGPMASIMNINNITLWMDRDAFFPWTIGSQGTAGEYPKGTGGLIFAEGMLWGVKVSDGKLPVLRVNGSTYATGLKAGKVLYDGSGKVIGSEDFNTRHVWRVRTDYAAADLTGDAASFFVKAIAGVSDGDRAEIFNQYEYDWNNWPVADGAPFDDVDGNGLYDPTVDIPGFPGASQTIWIVVNDLPIIVAGEDPSSVSETSYGSPPIGMEMQLTMWAYDFATTNPLGNMMFKEAKIIYTGLIGGPLDAKLDTVYFTQWSDPDLGDFGDDFVGTDTTLSLGYVYNGNATDAVFLGSFGLPVPAGGYDFLQGPIVDGDTMAMTVFNYFASGSAVSDPDIAEYNGTLQWFNLMEGFLPRPEYPEQIPWVDDLGNPTKFTLAGDPVTGIGDIDGVLLAPGDRRLTMTTGPFSMALGDTQVVVLALIGALGADNLSSVTKLKAYDKFAQLAFDNNFDLWAPPSRAVVSGFGGDGKVNIYWGHNLAAVAATEATVKRGMVFEGYNIYQLPSASATVSEGVLIGKFDVINGITTILEEVEGPEIGIVLEVVAQEGTDTGISRSLLLDVDHIRNRPISNDIFYYYGISAYSVYDTSADAPGAVQPPFNHLESGLSVVTITPQMPASGTQLGADVGTTLDVTHSVGASDGVVEVVVMDPKLITGHEYEVTFSEDTDSTSATFGELVWSVRDNTAAKVVLTGQPQVADVAITIDQPIVDGMQVKVAGPALVLVDWEWEDVGEVSPLYPTYDRGRWISGADWGANALFGGFGMAGIFWFEGEQGHEGVEPGDFKTVELRFTHMISYTDTDGDGAYTALEPYTFDVSKGQKAFMYETWGPGNFQSFSDIPFQAWDVDDPANPRQLNVVIRDREPNGQWDIWSDDGDVFNYVWIMDSDYDASGAAFDPGQGGVDFMDQLAGSGSGIIPAYYTLWGVNRGDREFLARDGILRGFPARVNLETDVFTFTAPATTSSTHLAELDMDKINVFPNPYYGFHILERSRDQKWVKFNHLPPRVTIRIFSLGGVMVRVLSKHDANQYLEWDLKNQAGFPVASGIYIAQVDATDLGKTKILKLAIVQEEQILNKY